MRISRTARSAHRQRGIVLISTMLLLLVLTIFALSMFRSYGLQEKIAGNVREKQRAVQNAVGAQVYAENWLSNLTTTAPLEVTCSSGVTMATSPAVVQVCKNAMTSAAVLVVPWAYGFRYNAPTNFVLSGSSPQSNSFEDYPVFYITDVGPSGFGEAFQVDAWAWAATSDTTAIVESTYLVKPTVPCGSCYGGGAG